MNTQILQEKLAWQTAYQLRACPDDKTLFSKSAETLAHLASCMFCQERLENTKADKKVFQEFSLQIGARLPQARTCNPEAGQVWSISRKKSAWGPRNRFYNSPRVLLLNAIEGSKGFIAAQLFSEKALMGKGDVWINDAFGFAEAWNTYSVHADMLESCRGEVDSSMLKEICRAADLDWELSPEGSLLQSFRQIEVSVASFFSMQAVAQLTEEFEAAPEFVTQMNEAFQKIKAFVRDLTFGDMELLGQGYAMAYATRSAEEVDPETAAKIASLKEDEAIKLLPIDHGQFKVGYKLMFQNLSWLSEEPLPVRVTVRGVVVEKVQWDHWGAEETWLVLTDTVIRKDDVQADETFLSVSWDDSCLQLKLLPAHP
ncbi:MAG: hypothetical protein ACOYL3_01775 [Desulfuromonadaceae bacterium]